MRQIWTSQLARIDGESNLEPCLGLTDTTVHGEFIKRYTSVTVTEEKQDATGPGSLRSTEWLKVHYGSIEANEFPDGRARCTLVVAR